MDIENRVFLALYNEYKKIPHNMRSITSIGLGLSEEEFNYALQRLQDRNIIYNVYVTRDPLSGRIVKSYLDDVRLTKDAYEYYEAIAVPCSGKEAKVFISHSSEDCIYAEAFVGFMERLGLSEESIFCSAVPGYGVPLGENIIDYIFKQFDEYDLRVYYLLSDNFYKSPISLNEMGAARSLKNKYCAILLPGFGVKQIAGVIDQNKIAIVFDANINEIKCRLRELRDELITLFGIPPLSEEKWERIRDEFIKNIKRA
ncbi:MAG: hypothetical protein HFG94_05270 [Dorea sp.]|nr:hypothetical protein [Dorea sp.]